MDDDIPSSDSSGANSAASGEGYIADISEGGNSSDSGNISMTSGEANSSDSSNISMTNGQGNGAGDFYNLETPSPTPYHVYNLQESQNSPALEEVMEKSKFQWLDSEDVAHICNLPSELTLTKQIIQSHDSGLYLFHKWMHPDVFNWDSISGLRSTRDCIPLYYTVAKQFIGPLATGVRTTFYRKIYELMGSLKSDYILVHYICFNHHRSVSSCDDSGISTHILDSENSNGSHSSDEDFIGEA